MRLGRSALKTLPSGMDCQLVNPTTVLVEIDILHMGVGGCGLRSVSTGDPTVSRISDAQASYKME